MSDKILALDLREMILEIGILFEKQKITCDQFEEMILKAVYEDLKKYTRFDYTHDENGEEFEAILTPFDNWYLEDWMSKHNIKDGE